MKRLRKLDVLNSDDFDILSAIWILASNDENPIITYQGITYRLGLPKDYDAKRFVKAGRNSFGADYRLIGLKSGRQYCLPGGTFLPGYVTSNMELLRGRR